MAKREIVLDTETTGLDPKKGDRVIEIGCIEILERRRLGDHFHVYINPERKVHAEAEAIHGLSNQFLSDKPLFKDIAEDFLRFVDDAELIIHNAPFDVGFLNREFELLGRPFLPLTAYCKVVDTLVLARQKHPGQRNSLDALCKRYNVDNSQRDLHGALLDSEILAQVYIAMRGGQSQLFAPAEPTAADSANEQSEMKSPVHATEQNIAANVIQATPGECDAHRAYLVELAKSTPTQTTVWQKLEDDEHIS